MNQDICILLTPARFLSLIFDSLTQSVRPITKALISIQDCQEQECKSPFDPTLLPPPFISHPFSDLTPEDIVIKVFALVSSHLSNDAR